MRDGLARQTVASQSVLALEPRDEADPWCVKSLALLSLSRFVAKDPDGQFHCHVFRCANKDKAHAVALTVAKGFYLAYQVGVVLGSRWHVGEVAGQGELRRWVVFLEPGGWGFRARWAGFRTRWAGFRARWVGL